MKPKKPAKANPGKSPSPVVRKNHVVVIEDQRLVAEFFTFHCRDLGLQVVKQCATCADGLAAIRAELPELVLLDISLPDGDGLELARTVIHEMPQVKILSISSHRDPWTMLQVQRIGLHGFVDKNEQRPEVLTDAIRTVLEGGIFYTSVVNESSAAIRRDPKAFIRVLSDYETIILSIIGESKTDAEIGKILNISASTVQSRRRDIMHKLDIHSTPKLIHYALTHGLTRADQLVKRKPA